MISKKLLLYSISGTVSITSATAPILYTVNDKQSNIKVNNIDKRDKTTIFLNDYKYNHLIKISENTLNALKKEIFDNKKYIEIEKNIPNDIKEFSDLQFDIIKDTLSIKKINNTKMFCSKFQVKPKPGYYWSNFTVDAKVLEIPFANVKVDDNTDLKFWDANFSNNAWYYKEFIMPNKNEALLMKLLEENKSKFVDYKNFLNAKEFKNVVLKIKENKIFETNNKYFVKLVAKPIENHFWNDGSNFEKQIPLFLNINNEITNQIKKSFAYQNPIEINSYDLTSVKKYFASLENVNKVIKDLKEIDVNHKMFVWNFISVYEKDNKFYVKFKLSDKNSLAFSKINNFEIDVCLVKLKTNVALNLVNYYPKYSIQPWWGKELDLLANNKDVIFTNENLSIFKKKFEQDYKGLLVERFDLNSAFFGKQLNSVKNNKIASVNVFLKPSDNFLWTDKTKNTRKATLIIEGWYLRSMSMF